MKVLKGSAEEKTLLQRYTRQLNTQEDGLKDTATESESIERQLDAAQTEIDKAIAQLSFDVKL